LTLQGQDPSRVAGRDPVSANHGVGARERETAAARKSRETAAARNSSSERVLVGSGAGGGRREGEEGRRRRKGGAHGSGALVLTVLELFAMHRRAPCIAFCAVCRPGPRAFNSAVTPCRVNMDLGDRTFDLVLLVPPPSTVAPCPQLKPCCRRTFSPARPTRACELIASSSERACRVLKFTFPISEHTHTRTHRSPHATSFGSGGQLCVGNA
jgi:hypothetical protein